MSIYLRKNALPIFIEIIFVVSCFFVPQEYYIYSNLLFYLLLFADFYVKREFSFRKWVKNLKGGKTFWKQVIVTTVFFLIVFGLTTALESFFPNLDTGMIMLKRDTPARLIAFAISTMFLPAITEESFYRKSIISFRSKPALVLSAVFGMLLYAAEHSLKPWGIFLTAIWALPLTISYTFYRADNSMDSVISFTSDYSKIWIETNATLSFTYSVKDPAEVQKGLAAFLGSNS